MFFDFFNRKKLRSICVRKKEIYKILKDGIIMESGTPGKYAGWRPRKIFGRLDCKSGMRMKKESRVFFHSYEEAIAQGYRPCKKCRPTP